MRFKSLYMFNFMRYKGENRLDFSCDREHPVTVVLGGNTCGKTTLSQAFRFALYGMIQAEQGKKQTDYCLLNRSVIERMDANSVARVEVRLEFERADVVYRITRTIRYRRKLPGITLVEQGHTQRLEVMDGECVESLLAESEDEIKLKMEEFLPYYLSPYFLFDGEKWIDKQQSNGLQKNIRESVREFTGLTSLFNAMQHLKDMGRDSVVRYFEGRITGGNIYDSISAQKQLQEADVQQLIRKLQNIRIEQENIQKKIDEVEAFLENNRETEMLQKQLREISRDERDKQDQVEEDYKNLYQRFSELAPYFCAVPLVKRCTEMLQEAHMERRDVPYMKQGTIDYLIQRGTCVCGNPLCEGNAAYQTLIEFREYLPPADIGSLLGDFEKTAKRWNNRAETMPEIVTRAANNVRKNQKLYLDRRAALASLTQAMDSDVNFQSYRMQLKEYQRNLNAKKVEEGSTDAQIRDKREKIRRLEEELRGVETRNQANMLCRARAEIAKELYEDIKKSYQEKEQKIFLELNQAIQKNFQRIFVAKDKKVVLDKDYQVKMLYAEGDGYHEETNLSEGEKIARNFAFIISILEYSQEQKRLGDEDIEVLPIVLDGPFSKLSKENIGKVSAVLPQIAEQVIVFMLEKDWEHTQMDSFVGARYQIDKGVSSVNAAIRRMKDGE